MTAKYSFIDTIAVTVALVASAKTSGDAQAALYIHCSHMTCDKSCLRREKGREIVIDNLKIKFNICDSVPCLKVISDRLNASRPGPDVCFLLSDWIKALNKNLIWIRVSENHYTENQT